MAQIIGAIGTSHVPTIGIVFDCGRHDDPAWAPLLQGYAPVVERFAQKKPDVLVIFYNDHATTLFFDAHPTSAFGPGERFPIAEGCD